MYPGSTPDQVSGFQYLRDVYTAGKADFTGRVTVPVLWDTVTEQIVNNESYEIALMLNEAFHSPDTVDLYPVELREEIETINEDVYNNLNNGVYKTGFAVQQADYETNAHAVFACLDRLESRLSTQRYLVGNVFTIADVRLFVTLLRFDPVYFVHFKCSQRLISSYPHLSNYLRDVYQTPGVSDTVNMDHIRTHYFRSHVRLNPFTIVPIGPIPDLGQPHDRHRFGTVATRRSKSSGKVEALAEVVATFALAVLG